jgi:hypothetical protein
MHFLWKQGGPISWGKDAKFRDFTENGGKSAPCPNRKASGKGPKWPIFYRRIPPFWGVNEFKIGPFKLIWPEKYPKRASLYDKKSRGVPVVLGVFGPFFGKILVQNALFMETRRLNFMGKRREI